MVAADIALALSEAEDIPIGNQVLDTDLLEQLGVVKVRDEIGVDVSGAEAPRALEGGLVRETIPADAIQMMSLKVFGTGGVVPKIVEVWVGKEGFKAWRGLADGRQLRDPRGFELLRLF